MKSDILWSDLLIEQGKLDPLALWRVGDRLISDLLGPFTTVVTHRPARYFSMYSWLFYYLNELAPPPNKEAYWKRFFELEALLLCAIQLHQPHLYDNFRGQIGSEAARGLLSKVKANHIKLSDISRIQNGWENNYKSPMYIFKLVETDFDSISNVRLTGKGLALAKAYHDSIKETYFYRKFINSASIPINILEALSKKSCPCLLFSDSSLTLLVERDAIKKHLLRMISDPRDESEHTFNRVVASIYLITHCMVQHHKENAFFSGNIWRMSLFNYSCGNTSYIPLASLIPVYHMWEIYNLDALLVFTLENGLAGFLENLHKSGGRVTKNQLSKTIFAEFTKWRHSLAKELNFPLDQCALQTLESLIQLPFVAIEKLSLSLFEKMSTLGDKKKLFYSFLLYLIVQAIFLKLSSSDNYKEAFDFYAQQTQIDGTELSLLRTQKVIEANDLETYDFFFNIFLTEWIINRQTFTRGQRHKDLAWFSFNNETNSYCWESPYETNPFRADRTNILLTFLLNLNLVKQTANGWFPVDIISLYNDYL